MNWYEQLIYSTWPWWVAGPAMGICMFILLSLGRRLGISSSHRLICSIAGAGKKISYFNFNWKEQVWLLVFVAGTILGGLISHLYMPTLDPLPIAADTIGDLGTLGIEYNGGFFPRRIFSMEGMLSFRGFTIMVLGGFSIGFGARYAGGCTSGHTLSGLAEGQLPSLIATAAFFAGGLISTNLILSWL